MLESLIKPEILEHKSYEMFFMALAIGAVSITMAALITRNNTHPYASYATAYLAVAFACIATAPIMVRIIQKEERKDEVTRAGPFFGGYWCVIKTYIFYFLGIIVIFSLVFALLPMEKSNQLFSAQIEELVRIRGERIENITNSNLAANVVRTGAAVNKTNIFFKILFNNLSVLTLALIFSFIFGAGAIYIITWNASIIGVLIGAAAKEGIGLKVGVWEAGKFIAIHNALPPECCSILGSITHAIGKNILVSYSVALPCSLLALTPHGIFEISAYFMAGLVGGILSTISVNNKLPDREVILHSTILLAVAIAFIFIGAAIEAGL
ncbi:MAG: hypothetical protein J7L23_01350 [Candidatus Diapherotrites archaeon]|nr:hypothetical protein [Candidatus Diapherotrites archaeon]